MDCGPVGVMRRRSSEHKTTVKRFGWLRPRFCFERSLSYSLFSMSLGSGGGGAGLHRARFGHTARQRCQLYCPPRFRSCRRWLGGFSRRSCSREWPCHVSDVLSPWAATSDNTDRRLQLAQCCRGCKVPHVRAVRGIPDVESRLREGTHVLWRIRSRVFGSIRQSALLFHLVVAGQPSEGINLSATRRDAEIGVEGRSLGTNESGRGPGEAGV